MRPPSLAHGSLTIWLEELFRMGKNINATRAEKVIRAYADGTEGLTGQECTGLGISPDSCRMLKEALDWGSKGIITPGERARLIDAGFGRGFVENLAGTDGKKALLQRVKWLTGHLDHLNHLSLKQGLMESQVNELIRVVLELYHMGPDARGAIGALTYVVKNDNLIYLMRDKNKQDQEEIVDVRRFAVQALGIMGLYSISSQDAEKAISALIMAMNIRAPEQYKNAELAQIDLTLYKEAILSLCAFGPRAKFAVPYIIIALKHEDTDVRVKASFALLRIGPGAAMAVSPLTAALEDDEPKVQVNAAGALGAIGSPARSAVPHLEKKLTNNNPQLRKNAALSLGKIGQPTGSSIAALIDMAKNDPELYCRAAAASSLKKLWGQTEKSDVSEPTPPHATFLKP